MKYRVWLSSADGEDPSTIQVVVEADSFEGAQRRALEEHPTRVVERVSRNFSKLARIFFLSAAVLGFLFAGITIYNRGFKNYGQIIFFVWIGLNSAFMFFLGKPRVIGRGGETG